MVTVHLKFASPEKVFFLFEENIFCDVYNFIRMIYFSLNVLKSCANMTNIKSNCLYKGIRLTVCNPHVTKLKALQLVL